MSATDDVREIQRLLIEAYAWYFANDDGYCKSSEAAVSLHWPPYWDIEGNPDIEPSCEVYSYVFGPSRSHHFHNTTEALTAVREWLAEYPPAVSTGEEQKPDGR